MLYPGGLVGAGLLCILFGLLFTIAWLWQLGIALVLIGVIWGIFLSLPRRRVGGPRGPGGPAI